MTRLLNSKNVPKAMFGHIFKTTILGGSIKTDLLFYILFLKYLINIGNDHIKIKTPIDIIPNPIKIPNKVPIISPNYIPLV